MRTIDGKTLALAIQPVDFKISAFKRVWMNYGGSGGRTRVIAARI